jgi:hypothetical protein
MNKRVDKSRVCRILAEKHGLSSGEIAEVLGCTAANVRYHMPDDITAPAYNKMPLEERFWDKVDVRGSEECWLWQGAKDGEYGVLSDSGKKRRAHRVSYEIDTGGLNPDLHVCHHCDTPSCVNPNHLYQGTEQDNTDDMVNRNRQAKGSDFSNTELSEQDVAEVRRQYRDTNKSTYKIAAELPISPSQVRRIVNGDQWQHAGGPIRGQDYQ